MSQCWYIGSWDSLCLEASVWAAWAQAVLSALAIYVSAIMAKRAISAASKAEETRLLKLRKEGVEGCIIQMAKLIAQIRSIGKDSGVAEYDSALMAATSKHIDLIIHSMNSLSEGGKVHPRVSAQLAGAIQIALNTQQLIGRLEAISKKGLDASPREHLAYQFLIEFSEEVITPIEIYSDALECDLEAPFPSREQIDEKLKEKGGGPI